MGLPEYCWRVVSNTSILDQMFRMCVAEPPKVDYACRYIHCNIQRNLTQLVDCPLYVLTPCLGHNLSHLQIQHHFQLTFKGYNYQLYYQVVVLV